MMTKDELKKLDASALVQEAESLKKELFNLKIGKITGQVKDTSQFQKLRRQIARVLMLKQQKQNAVQRQEKR